MERIQSKDNLKNQNEDKARNRREEASDNAEEVKNQHRETHMMDQKMASIAAVCRAMLSITQLILINNMLLQPFNKELFHKHNKYMSPEWQTNLHKEPSQESD